MKKSILLFSALLLTSLLFAQPPQKMSYQTIIRNATDDLVSNTEVGIQISVLQGTSSGTAVYVETHAPMTNANGLASLEIGAGTPVTGTMEAIDWGSGPYFLKSEVDIAGGTNYTLSLVSELLSVPYALHAFSSGDGQWSESGAGINTSNDAVGINSFNPEYTLDVRSSSQTEAAELNVSNDDKSRYLRLFSGGETFPDPAVIWQPGHGLQFATYDQDAFDFQEKFRISSAGDVGIGVPNPEARLDILGGDWNLDSGNPGDLRIGNGTNNFRIGIATGGGGAGDTRMYTDDASLFIGTNSRPSLVINKNENVGIGTIDPTARLEIQSDALGDTIILIDNSSVRSNLNYGIHLVDDNPESTIGAYFEVDSIGIYGLASNWNGEGVKGRATGQYGRGIVGDAYGTDGVGVYGYGKTGVFADSSTPGGTALLAISSSSTGTNFGVDAIAFGLEGTGVKGKATGSNGIGVFGEGPLFGVHGLSNGSSGLGVKGEATGTDGIGIYGEGPSTGIEGFASDGTAGGSGVTSEVNSGVRGRAMGVSSRGVEGISTGFVGRGVYGEGQIGVEGISSVGAGAIGIRGESTATDGIGVYGEAVGNAGYGVFGKSENSSGSGVYGETSNSGTEAVYGANQSSSGSAYGVRGSSSSSAGTGVFGEGALNGVRGSANGASGNGVSGLATATSGRGVFGEATGESGKALYGEATGEFGKGVHAKITSVHSSANAILAEWGGGSSYAGYFVGRVHVAGVLSKSSGSFKIDHPLDPENKYLSHSFVESPDMMNIYNGNVTTDEQGNALVELPHYFEALNMDFRYQLTVMGQFAQAIVIKKIEGNSFEIKTDKPTVEVSWQVTGVRNDAFAKKNRIQVEEDKEVANIGTYLNPEAFGERVSKD